MVTSIFLEIVGTVLVGFVYPAVKGPRRLDEREAPPFKCPLTVLFKSLKERKLSLRENAGIFWYLGWSFFFVGSVLQLIVLLCHPGV